MSVLLYHATEIAALARQVQALGLGCGADLWRAAGLANSMADALSCRAQHHFDVSLLREEDLLVPWSGPAPDPAALLRDLQGLANNTVSQAGTACLPAPYRAALDGLELALARLALPGGARTLISGVGVYRSPSGHWLYPQPGVHPKRLESGGELRPLHVPGDLDAALPELRHMAAALQADWAAGQARLRAEAGRP